MKLIMVDGGGTNITSLLFALKRLDIEPVLTDNIEEIRNADKVILPGVGAAGNAMRLLREKNLVDCIRDLKQPVMGICLGMQLLFNMSEEGNVDCLGIVPDNIKRIPDKKDFTIPHMGWNSLKTEKPDPLLKGINEGAFVYFVHSYYAPVSQYTLSSTDYSCSISAIVKNNNFYGCQFHPEKSGIIGSGILKNFLEL